MQQTVSLILEFINNATGPLEGAVSAARSAFTGLTSTSQQTGNAMSSIWAKTGGAVIGHIQSISQQVKLASLLIGGTLVNDVGNLLNMAGQFQRFGTAAEYLTGSAKAADQFAQSVRSISTATMFNVDQIAELDSRLIGNTKNVQQSDKVLRALADAVAATGGSYPELESATRAWIQTNSKAIASSEELNRQFSNANIPMLRLLAQHIVNDADSPLRKYIQTAQSAGGASAALSKSYETASGKLQVYQDTLKKAQMAQDEYSKKSGKVASVELGKQIAVENAQLALDKAQGTIANYNKAQSTMVTSGTQAKLTVQGVMAQLQDLGSLKIPGSIMGAEITKALNEAYGGANQKLLNTFQGQLSELGDVAKLTALSLLGLDQNFRVVKGGILDILTSALKPLVQWLQSNQKAIQDFAGKFATSTPVLMGFAAFLLGAMYPALVFVVGPILDLALTFGALGIAVGFIIEKLGGFQNIIKVVGGVIQNAFSAIQDAFNKSSAVIQGYLDKYSAEFKAFGERVYKALDLDPSKMGIGDFFSQLGQKMKPQLDNFVAQIQQGFSNGLKVNFGSSGNLADLLGRLMTLLNGVTEVILRVFTPAIEAMKKGFEAASPQIDKLLQQLGPAFINALQIIGGAIAAIVIVVVGLITGLVEAFAYALPMIVQFFTGVMEIINGIMNIIVGIFTLNFGQIIEGFKDLGKGIMDIVVGFFGTILTFVYGFIHGVIDFFQQLYDVLIGHSIIPDLVNGIIMFFQNLYATVLGIIANWVVSIINYFASLATDAVSKFTNFVSSVVNWAGTLKDKVVNTIKSMGSSIGDVFKGLASDAINWGKNILHNLMNGLKDAVRSAGKAGGVLLSKMGLDLSDLNFDHGGIVPGPVGAPILATVHGGEQIIPRTGVQNGMGGNGATVNFYGDMTLDSEQRVQELANKIVYMLGRQNQLARYGAGY